MADHTQLSSPREIRALLIVRLGSMGDVIHAMPAVSALRSAYPEAKFGWVVEERWSELLAASADAKRGPGKPLVDSIHTVNTKAWRTSPLSDETWREIAAVVGEIRETQYEVAIDFQGAIKSALVAGISDAIAKYGFVQPRERLATMFYSHTVVAKAKHVVEQNVELASAAAGMRLCAAAMELPLSPEVERWCEGTLNEQGVRRFAIINPGAGWGAKQWPEDRYGDVARKLGAVGVRSIVNYGPGEESLAGAVAEQSEGAAIPLKSSLSELIALTRRAALFVGGDTGPMHLAAALGVPVVALFGPTDPSRNGPYATRSVVLRNATSRTSYKHHSRADEGLLSISVDEVHRAACVLMEQQRG